MGANVAKKKNKKKLSEENQEFLDGVIVMLIGGAMIIATLWYALNPAFHF